MRFQKVFFVLMAVLAVGVLAAACAGSATPEPVEFTIEMSEFLYSPDTIEVQVGQEVTIILVNNGALKHEFMLGRNGVMKMDGIPMGYTEDFFEVAGVDPMVMVGGQMLSHDEIHQHGEGEMAHQGFMVTVEQGVPAAIIFTVTEDMVGEWEIGCFLDGGSHYVAGMFGTLIVNP